MSSTFTNQKFFFKRAHCVSYASVFVATAMQLDIVGASDPREEINLVQCVNPVVHTAQGNNFWRKNEAQK